MVIYCQKKLFFRQYIRSVFNFSPALIVALVLGTGFYICSAVGLIRFPVMCTLAKEQYIKYASGLVSGNPVKYGTQYMVPFTLHSVETHDAYFSASGEVFLWVTAEIVEALYPQKYFSYAQPFIGNKLNHFEEILLYEKGLFIEKISVQYIPPKDIKSKVSFRLIDMAEASWSWANTADTMNISHRLNQIRALLRLQLKRVLASWDSAGGFLLALTSGAREYLDSNISQAFTTAGLAHILALSGMHIAILGGFAGFIGKKTGGKKTALWLSVVVLLIFLWFAGASPSLFRAVMFTLILCSAQICGLLVSPVSALALTFIIQLCLFPYDAQSISFMLSYAAVFGIIMFNEFIYHLVLGFVPLKSAVAHSVLRAFSVSVSAQIATTPITLLVFGSLTPIGLITSVIVSPMVSFFFIAGISGIILTVVFPFMAGIVSSFMKFIYTFIEITACLFARVPPIQISDIRVSLICMILSILCISYILIRKTICNTQRRNLYERFAQL